MLFTLTNIWYFTLVPLKYVCSAWYGYFLWFCDYMVFRYYNINDDDDDDDDDNNNNNNIIIISSRSYSLASI